jgi:hypothetical protein
MAIAHQLTGGSGLAHLTEQVAVIRLHGQK